MKVGIRLTGDSKATLIISKSFGIKVNPKTSLRISLLCIRLGCKHKELSSMLPKARVNIMSEPIIDKWSTVEETLRNDPDLNYREAGQDSLGEKALSSLKGIYNAITDGYTLQINISGGKDSESCLNLCLMALVIAVRNGTNISPHHFLLHADTGVENPEVQHLALSKLSALQSFVKKHNLPLKIIIAKPGFAQSWVGRILTGRGLPSFKDAKVRQCSQDLKVSAANKARKNHLKNLTAAQKNKVCLVLGSRDDESSRRKKSIERYNGSHTEVSTNKNGGEIYPVKTWSTENIWEFLLLLGDNKPLPCYTRSLASTAELYKDATGECIWTSKGNQPSSACGSRFGCFVCQAAGDDKSMTNLLEADDRYEYMKPLNRIQQLIAKTRYDWSKRNPVGRTIYEGGFIRWQPDVYSVEFTQKLLHACISADYMEEQRARAVSNQLSRGEIENNEHNQRMSKVQFRMVSHEEIIMIDFIWALHNFHDEPFKALKVYHDVWDRGILDTLSEVDDMETTERTPMPKAKWVHVGDNWFPSPGRGGLVDDSAAFTEFDLDHSSYTRPIKTQHGVRQLINANEDIEINVDIESAYFIFDYEYDYLMEKVKQKAFTPSEAAHYYLRLGAISIAKGKLSLYDRMAARGQRYRALGISGQQSIKGPDPSLKLKVLSNSEYKRYKERRRKAAYKRFEWWAFMGWFAQSHINLQSEIGRFLQKTLEKERQGQRLQEQQKTKNYSKEGLLNVITVLSLVKTDDLNESDPWVLRTTDYLQRLLSRNQRILNELRTVLYSIEEEIITTGQMKGAPASFDDLVNESLSGALSLISELKAKVNNSMQPKAGRQLCLAV